MLHSLSWRREATLRIHEGDGYQHVHRPHAGSHGQGAVAEATLGVEDGGGGQPAPTKGARGGR
eukprot:11889287-Prorocentrum_lima.AAC.1